MSLRLLGEEEKIEMMRSLAEGYSFDSEELDSLAVLEGEEGFWVVSPDVISLPLQKLRTDSIGVLLARQSGSGLTPTIAALQLFAKPRDNSIDLTGEEAAAFIERKPIRVEAVNGRCVVFHCGRALDLGRVKDGVLLRIVSRD